MPIEYKRRPTFWEIFKARCSTTDLGPISLNWFEELSSEAPPYNSESPEESEYKPHSYEPQLFKTPQRKTSYRQFASTPIIFKERSETVPLDQSPFQELGKAAANSKHKNHSKTKARADPMAALASPPLMSHFSESPLTLRSKQLVPQREKPVVCGSLFSTPKLEEGQTPKHISESLGVEVDPDMSWSSSLATPPTLSSTVIIARDEEVRGTAFPDDSPATSKSYFSNHHASLKKNDTSIHSMTDSKNKNQREAFSQGLGTMLRDSSGKINSVKDDLRKAAPNVLEDGETAADTSEEDSFSLCFPKHRTRNVQKMRMAKTRKKIFSETRTDDLSDGARRQTDETEPRDSDPLGRGAPSPKPLDSASERTCQEAAQSEDTAWSQLNLSGLRGTQTGGTSLLHISSQNQSDSGKDSIDAKKEGTGSATSGKSLLHTSSLPEPERMFSEDTLVDTKQRFESHEDSAAGKQAVSGTSQAACLFQSVRKSIFKMKEPLDETLGTPLSDGVTSSASAEEPEAPAWALGTYACSHGGDPLCPSLVDTGSWPVTLSHTSTAVKTEGLISTLRKKRRKFIYSVSDDASHQGKKLQPERKSESTNLAAQFEASAFEAPFTFTNVNSVVSESSVKRSCLQSDPEEPSLSLTDSFVTASDKESSYTNALIAQALNDREVIGGEEKAYAALETDSLPCFPERHCENNQKSPKVSDRKAEVSVLACHPAGQRAAAVQPSSISFESQESPVSGPSRASTLKVTLSSKAHLSKPVVVSRGKVSCQMPEKLRHESCKDNTELIENIPSEGNDICLSSENSKTPELLLPGEYITKASPSVKPQFNQNTKLEVIPKDQEGTPLISEVAVSTNSEELFPDDENNLAFQVANESSEAALESTVQLQEEDLSHAKGPSLKVSATAVAADLGGEHAARVSITEDSDSSLVHEGARSRSAEEQHLKGTADQDFKSSSSLPMKSDVNNDYTDKWSGPLDPVLNYNFGGCFRTASNKEIKLSELNVKKSKALFKDIDEQYPASSACMNIANTIALANQKRRGDPYTFDLQSVPAVPAHCASQASAPCEDAHTAPPTLSSKQGLHSLTPSQKAEITELSSILEESGSQFEFTQFRKPSRVAQSNASEVPGNQVVVVSTTSEEWKDVSLHLTVHPFSDAQTDDSKKFEGSVGAKQSFPRRLEGSYNKSTSHFLANINETEFGGFCSALGTKLSVSNEALQRAAKLFSDIENISEETSAKVDPSAFSSSAHHDSGAPVFKIRKGNYDKSPPDEETSKSHVKLQNHIEMTTGILVDKNPKNYAKNIKDEDNSYTGSQRNIYELEKCDDSKSSTGGTVYIHKGNSGFPCAGDQGSKYPESCTQYVREENTQIKESVSDLTCLEIMRAEETCHMKSSDKEQLPSGKMEQNIKENFNMSFQTASGKNIRVSKESLNKSVNIFNQETEEFAIYPDSLNSKSLYGINKNKIDISCQKKTSSIEKVFEEHDPVGDLCQLPVLQQYPGCEIESIKEPTLPSFHTASGKKVKIMQESLDKVKSLFDETQCVWETTSFSHQGSTPLKDREDHKEGLALACGRIKVTAPKCEEMQNFVSKDTEVLLKQSDDSYKPTENLRTSNGTSSKEHESIENEIESSRTCCISQSSCSVTEDSTLACYTGHSRKACIRQSSLSKGSKCLPEGPGDKLGKRNAAETTEDFAGNTSCEHSSDNTRTEVDTDDVSENQASALFSDPSMHHSCLSCSSFCHCNDMHNDSGHFLKTKTDSDVQLDMRNAEGNAIFSKVSATKEIDKYPQTVNEDCVQKSETNAPYANENVAIDFAVLDSKDCKAGCPVLTTAHSPDTVRKAEIFTDDGNKTIEQNRESEPGTCQAVCHKALDNPEDFICPISSDDTCMNSDKAVVYTQNEQMLPYNQSVSGLDKAAALPVSLGTWDTCKPVRELPQTDHPSRTYGIFSTASGKAVQVSDASLEKAKQVLSQMDGAKQSPSMVALESNEKPDHSGRRRLSVAHKPQGGLSLSKTFPGNASSSVFSGFSTAGGKAVSVSESTLHKVKGMLEEFELIRTEQHILQHSPTAGDLSKILPQPCVEKRTPEYPVNSKFPNIYGDRSTLPGNCKEGGSSGSTHSVDVSLQFSPLRRTQDTQLVLGTEGSLLKEANLLGKEQTLPQYVKIETGKAEVFSDASVRTNAGACSASSREPENYLETEAVEIAKAFMEDDELTDSKPSHVKHSLFMCPQSEALLNPGVRKRRGAAADVVGQPPIKRSLLNEFDRTIENKGKSLKPSKSSPDGTVKDRRLFTHHMSLDPVTCGPFCSRKNRQAAQTPHLTAPAQGLLSNGRPSECSALENSSSAPAAAVQPAHRTSAAATERARCSVPGKPAKVFVPPFKMKSQFHSDDPVSSRNVNLEEKRQKSTDREDSEDSDIHQFNKGSSPQEATGIFTECEAESLDLMSRLQNARGLQDIRIKRKERCHLRPQPGSLYLTKSSTLPRMSLQAAVGGRVPSACSHKQLYMYGVSKACIHINSKNAEYFQFDIQDYFGKEDLCAGKGFQLADGGWLIPSSDGKAGKEEFYRALCDTPGVDPKLISSAWVSNHYRWIVWKLAAMEFAFPKEFANRCLNPERVLLQLKYRYDVEIDNSSRSALKKILERDDTAAKTLVLCVSDIISPSASGSETSGSKAGGADTIELTDGWYAVKAQLDPPLLALVKSGRLSVGQKIVIHGAELVGCPDACEPLEAPDSLRLKISANSTRPARWHSKLGFSHDPRPFPLPLSSLFSDGGNVGCVDIVVQRVYPLQWVEKTASGLYIFRGEREEEKEALRFAEAQQKKLEALFTRVHAEFKDHEEDATQQRGLSRALTRQQVRALQDGAELYAAVQNASDPDHLEGCLSEEQLRALSTHRQMLNEKKQAQIQSEFRKALESAEQEEGLLRDVTTVWRLRVTSCKKKEKSALLSIWRPSPDLSSLLAEGKRYRIYHLAVSKSKSKFERPGIQLTATKRTQYQQLPASDETLSQAYQPREPLLFHRLSDPAFRPPCSEVDLVGVVVSVVKPIGLVPLVYLSDECLNLLVVKFGIDLNEDIKPRVLIAASNLQWHPESTSGVPTLFAGNLSVFSANPKEVHFQERVGQMKCAIENINTFYKEAEKKLMHLLKGDSPKWCTPSKDPTWEPHPAPTCPASDLLATGGQRFSPTSEQKFQSPLSHCTPKGKSTPLARSAQVASKSCNGEREIEDPRTCRKRRALDFLSRLPLPPPVSPISAFVSPAAQKAFQPPRSCGTKHAAPMKKKEPRSPQGRTPFQEASGISLLERDSVADEELALLTTQALAPNSAGQKNPQPAQRPHQLIGPRSGKESASGVAEVQ
ncbi:breast cancer type 2 susceptibility protein [Acomys russatus]|uniref:breast cancer type 2 susceptibility protein n=1 Tax=Acomys russatus TaxID=60746 RepID=UPI0021E23525|nr:breast cancer type 2 susceptibility protein [Acomys russatus]